MKTLLLALLLAALPAAARVHFRGDYDRAHREALEAGKYLLVLLTRPHDPATAETLAVLNRPAVSEWIGKHCVAVIVVTGQQNYPIELLYTTSLPALFLLDGREIPLAGPVGGRLDEKLFFEELVHEDAL